MTERAIDQDAKASSAGLTRMLKLRLPSIPAIGRERQHTQNNNRRADRSSPFQLTIQHFDSRCWHWSGYMFGGAGKQKEIPTRDPLKPQGVNIGKQPENPLSSYLPVF
jgi:hypothetical protein